MAQVKRMKGTVDILPAESRIWQYIEDSARAVFETYNFQEIRTPLFEAYELFARSSGDTSEIV